MADEVPPAGLPVPCAVDAILLEGWICVPDGESTKWVRTFVPTTEIGTGARVAAGGCGGGCPKKAAIELAKEKGWTATDLIAVLKALK